MIKIPWRDFGKFVWLRTLLCGFFIGAGSILPGVSGGVLAVVFGLYGPFMEMLTTPRTGLPKHGGLLPPLIIGCAAGFLTFAKWIVAAFAFSQSAATWMFIGLIVGTVPSLFRKAGQEGRPATAWLSFAGCALIVLVGLFYAENCVQAVIQPGFGWYTFCGVLLGAGVVLPGMSASPVLMSLGLYHPLLQGISSLELKILLACAPGFAAAVLLLARLIVRLYDRHYAVVFHGILGFVVASTCAIIPTEYHRGEIEMSVFCCVGGFSLAFLMEKFDHAISK